MNWLSLLGVALPLRIERVHLGPHRLHLELTTAPAIACCPVCGRQSGRIHSHYRRQLQDLPWGQMAVSLQLNCRKFFCDNAACQRVIFTEPLPEFAARYARRTQRLQQLFYWLGLALSGEAAARLSHRLFCPTSSDTILRGLRGRVRQRFPVPRVLGVDDFAFRRGHRYGTVLVDLEQRRVVDLLPDREAQTLVNWLRGHPGVEVISRDRAGAYAHGSRRGAPKAIQIADRWHLLKNAVETLEKQLWREQVALKKAAQPTVTATAEQPSPSIEMEPIGEEVTETESVAQQLKSQRRGRRLERYQRVCDLARQGFSIRAISLQTGLERKTVRRFLRAGEFPERASPKRGASKLSPYQDYLRQRIEQQERPGIRCGQQLFEEVRALGYRGCLTLVKVFLGRLRAEAGMVPLTRRGSSSPSGSPQQKSLSPRSVSWWLLKSEEKLKPQEQEYVQRLCGQSPTISRARALIRRFFDLVREQAADELLPWLAEAEACGLASLRHFALEFLNKRVRVRQSR